MTDPIDNKKGFTVLDFISYAGTPNGIPQQELKENFGSLNKQLAFSNLSDNALSDLEDLMRIGQLKKMSSQRDYELRISEKKGSDQSEIVSKCLASLGHKGFLLKTATTQTHNISQRNEQVAQKSKLWGLGVKPQQPQPLPSQAQGVRQ